MIETKALRTTAAAFLAVGGATLAMSRTGDLVRLIFPDCPQWPFLSLLGIGLVYGAGGLLLWLIIFLRTIYERLDPRYDCYRAKERDLKRIYDFCRPLLGDDLSDVDQMKRMFNRNQHIFWMVKRVERRGRYKDTPVVGCFSIIPLTHMGVQRVQAEEITGSQFAPEHIAKPRSARRAIYIGGIAAVGRRVQGVTLHFAQGHVARERASGVETVYTRPVTDDGLRLLRKYEFTAVSGRDEYEKGRIYMHKFDRGE